MPRGHTRDDIDRFHDYGVHVPSRSIYIGAESSSDSENESGVDHVLSERVIKNLHVLMNLSQSDPITVYLNNIGGDCLHGMAIYDAIKAMPCPVHIASFGNVMSMGAVIMQAGTTRTMSPHSAMMIHPGHESYSSNHVKTIRNWVEFNKKLDLKIQKILLDKIRQKNPDFTVSKLEKLMAFDAILFPEEALELGLIDSILEQK